MEVGGMDPKKLKRKKILLGFLEGFLVFLIIALGATVYLMTYQKSYANKIYPNIQFNDINLSGQSIADAKVAVENYNKKLTQQKITVGNGQQKVDISFADAGASLDVDKIVTDAYQIGRDNNFLFDIIKSAQTIYQDQKVEAIVKTDHQKFDALIQKISSDLAQKSVDAEISIDGGKVVITPSQKGFTIDSEDLINKISGIISSRTSKIIAAKTTFSNPAIVESNLTTAKSQAEVLMSKSITLKTDDQTFTVSKDQIGRWITFPKDASGQISTTIDGNQIASYVAGTLSGKIDIAVVNRKINAVTQAVISEGSNGRHLDRNNTTAQIKTFMLGSSNSILITLNIIQDVFTDQQVFPDEGVVPGRFPGKYIDIDLTHQQMYLFEGPNQIAQYQVSTGKWSTPTPVGTRYIVNKDPMAWSAPYGLYMPWWNSIGEGYGIHELPEWPGGAKEGEAHLGIPVSHGCIRLGVGPAQTVYNWADIGTPVYIHK